MNPCAFRESIVEIKIIKINKSNFVVKMAKKKSRISQSSDKQKRAKVASRKTKERAVGKSIRTKKGIF